MRGNRDVFKDETRICIDNKFWLSFRLCISGSQYFMTQLNITDSLLQPFRRELTSKPKNRWKIIHRAPGFQSIEEPESLLRIGKDPLPWFRRSFSILRWRLVEYGRKTGYRPSIEGT